jgi:hypothetical protein
LGQQKGRKKGGGRWEKPQENVAYNPHLSAFGFSSWARPESFLASMSSLDNDFWGVFNVSFDGWLESCQGKTSGFHI